MPRPKAINFTLFNIQTMRPCEFLNKLEALCRKYAVKTGKGKRKGKDYIMSYDFEEGDSNE